VPASDLIQELEKKGTVGLVDRLRNIKKVGVIAQ
jgi:type IV pilus assembly protein PilN